MILKWLQHILVKSVRLFMKHEMEQFKESPAGKHATLHERQKQRKFLKEEQFKASLAARHPGSL
jgi:hypothetical protein